jgi:hypothetical protein
LLNDHRNTSTTDTTSSNNTRNNLSDAEYQAFRAFQDDRIRQTALAEGRASAFAEHLAEDAAADAIALKKLSDRGFSLKDAFGRLSTSKGRDTLANIHKSSFASKSGNYTRLRRLAVAEGLVQ